MSAGPLLRIEKNASVSFVSSFSFKRHLSASLSPRSARGGKVDEGTRRRVNKEIQLFCRQKERIFDQVSIWPISPVLTLHWLLCIYVYIVFLCSSFARSPSALV